MKQQKKMNLSSKLSLLIICLFLSNLLLGGSSVFTENPFYTPASSLTQTGMAMLQIEEVKAATQLTKARELQQTLYRIDPEQHLDNVQLGSLVQTTTGVYFISIPRIFCLVISKKK